MLYIKYSRKWVGGDIVQALAYDVPIPGYKTKNTISLRLWEARASSDDFNLFLFNDGQYESASQLHSRAQQVGVSTITSERMLWPAFLAYFLRTDPTQETKMDLVSLFLSVCCLFEINILSDSITYVHPCRFHMFSEKLV